MVALLVTWCERLGSIRNRKTRDTSESTFLTSKVHLLSHDRRRLQVFLDIYINTYACLLTNSWESSRVQKLPMSGYDMSIVLSWWNVVGNCPVVYKCPVVNPWMSCFTRCSVHPTLNLSWYINGSLSSYQTRLTYLTSLTSLTSFHATCARQVGARCIGPRCNYLSPSLRRDSWLHWYNTSISCIYVKRLKKPTDYNWKLDYERDVSTSG